VLASNLGDARRVGLDDDAVRVNGGLFVCPRVYRLPVYQIIGARLDLPGQVAGPRRAGLVAVDGSIAGDVAGQVGRVSADVTYLALSVGGNDALSALERLSCWRSLAQGLRLLVALVRGACWAQRSTLVVAAGPCRPQSV